MRKIADARGEIDRGGLVGWAAELALAAVKAWAELQNRVMQLNNSSVISVRSIFCLLY